MKKLTRQDIIANLPEHLKGRTIHIVGPNDDYDDEEGSEGVDPEYDQMNVPKDEINKREKVEDQRMDNEGSKNLRLTKHLKPVREFKPCFTGGAFEVIQNGTMAIAVNDMKVCLFELASNQLLSTLSHENEDVSTFAVSPNQQWLATSNKNSLIRVYRLPQLPEDAASFSEMECLKTFKTTNQLVVEMQFDPSSKFLAAGTSDSHIKVFDINNGFQTHNFLGHRGLIVKMVFYPEASSLKLLTCAEDFVIRVWDLVLKKEVAAIKPKGLHDNMAHATTSMLFTKDKRTLITSGRDGCIHFWNAADNFSHLSTLSLATLGCPKEEEVLCMQYIHSQEDPCLVFGGSLGTVWVYSIKRQSIVSGLSEIKQTPVEIDGESNQLEISSLHLLPDQKTLFCVNSDQNLFTYEIKTKHHRFEKLQLRQSSCLYLDEIIDAKFVCNNKFAILCSNSENLKLMNLETGNSEIYSGHSDIVLSLDVWS